MAEMTGFLKWCWRPGLSFQFQAMAWLNPGHCGCLGSEPVDRSSVSVCVCLSVSLTCLSLSLQIKNKILGYFLECINKSK